MSLYMPKHIQINIYIYIYTHTHKLRIKEGMFNSPFSTPKNDHSHNYLIYVIFYNIYFQSPMII